MQTPIILKIFYSGNNGWDMSKCKRIVFKNKLKADFFSRYYTKNHDCLIQYYSWGIWIASFCAGREIWNCF